MALELATAIIRARFDTADLKAQVASARKIIEKGLAGIRVRVRVDVDMASAKAAGARAGKTASKAASTSFTMQSRRVAGGAAPLMLGHNDTRIMARYRGGMPTVQMGAKPPSQRGGFVVHPHRLGYSPPQQRRIGGPVYDVPPENYRTRPSGGGYRFRTPNGGTVPLGEFRSGWRGGSPTGGGGGRGGSGGAPPFVNPGGRVPGYTPRATGNMPRFSGAKAFALGAGFQMAPNVTTAAAFGGVPGLAGAAAGAGIMAGTKAYMDFEKPMEMTKILQRQAGATDDQLAKLESRARSLGRTMIYSATEAAEAMETLTRGGMRAETVYETLPNVMNMAAAGGMENLANAADITIAAMAQFNMTAADSARIADTMVTAANSAQITVQDLGTSLSYTGRTASDAGLSIEQATAALAVLGKGGIPGSMGGTAFRQLTLDMNKSKTREQFAKIGIKTLSQNPVEVARQAVPAFASMSDDQKDDFLSDAGFRGNVQNAFKSLVAGIGLYDEILRNMAEDTGAADRIAKERMKAMWATFKRVTDAFTELGISVTELLHPMIIGLAEAVRTLTDFVSLLARTSKDLIEMMPESVRKIMGSLLRVGSAAIIGGVGTGLMGLPPIVGAAIFGGAAAVNEFTSFSSADAETPTGSGGVNPMGDKTDDAAGASGGAGGFGGSGGARRGGSLVDTKSIWSHIQMGLNGDNTVDQIEKNTAEIAKNTKPKTIAGEKTQAPLPFGFGHAVAGVASGFTPEGKRISASGSIVPAGSVSAAPTSPLATAAASSGFGGAVMGIGAAFPALNAPAGAGVGVATGPFPNTPEGRKQRAEFLQNARRVRRKGASGELAFKQGKAKIAAEEEMQRRKGNAVAPRNPLQEGTRRRELGIDYRDRARSMDAQADEWQKQYDAMPPGPEKDALRKRIAAMREGANKNRELSRMAHSNSMGVYTDASDQEIEDQKRRYRSGKSDLPPDQFFKNRADAKAAEESGMQDKLMEGFQNRLARYNPVLRQAELDRDTALSTESGNALRNRARGLEDVARPRYQATESGQVITSGRERMKAHKEFIDDPNKPQYSIRGGVDDQFTQWWLDKSKTAGQGMNSIGGKQEKVVDEIEENTGETVDVLKRMEDQLKNLGGGTWR